MQLDSNSSQKKKIVVVLGMHRCGTSLVTRGLLSLGFDLGQNLIEAKADNPKGFWEDKAVVALNDEILSTLSMSWESLRHVDLSLLESAVFDSHRDQARNILETHFCKSKSFAIKDPRLSRLLPFWGAIFDELHLDINYLIVIRNPLSVGQSLAKRNGFSANKSFLLWLGHLIPAIQDTAKFSRLVVDYDSIIDSPESEIVRISRFLSVDDSVDSQKINDFTQQFLDKDLRHELFHDKDFCGEVGVKSLTEQTYRLLLQAAKDEILLESNSFESQWKEIEREYRNNLPLCDYLDARANVIDDVAAGVIDSQQAQLESQKRQLEEQNSHIQTLSNTIDELLEDIDQRKQHIEQLSGEITERENTIRDVTAYSAQKEEEFESERKVFKEDLEAYSRHITEIFNSTSWRITAPLRKIKSLFFPLPKDDTTVSVLSSCDPFFIDVAEKRDLQSLQLLSEKRRVFVESEGKKEEYEEWPHLDISVVTFNSERWLEKFFKSLLNQKYPLKHIQIIFVDNGSSDNSISLIKRLKQEHSHLFRGFEILQQENYGFGAGHNYAFSKCESPYFLVSNVDLEFEPDAIVNVIHEAETDSAECVCWELRQKPYEHPKYYNPITLETMWCSHACALMRSDAFRRVGGYEKKIFMYGEDVELSFRFWDRGFRLKYCPKAVVWHYSYQEPEQVKPLQFTGSTLANFYIRLRYGKLADIFRIPSLYGSLLSPANKIPGGISAVLKNMAKLVINTPYFLMTRKKSSRVFPFRKWDYEIRREGAFYKYKEMKCDQFPLVSIITSTAKGREHYLYEVAATVLNQTYPHLEWIVVEEEGDAFQDFVSSLKENSGLEIVYKSLPGKGLYSAASAGIASAHGKYMMILEDDKLLFPDHIEVLVSEMEQQQHVIAACGLGWDLDIKEENGEKGTYPGNIIFDPLLRHQKQFGPNKEKEQNIIPTQPIVFDRSFYERYEGVDEFVKNFEDWNFWLTCSEKNQFMSVKKTTSISRILIGPTEER